MFIKARPKATLQTKNKIREHGGICEVKTPPWCVASVTHVCIQFPDGYIRWFLKSEIDLQEERKVG